MESAQERRRWDLALAIASELLSVGGEPAPAAAIWQMTRSLYNDPDIPS